MSVSRLVKVSLSSLQKISKLANYGHVNGNTTSHSFSVALAPLQYVLLTSRLRHLVIGSIQILRHRCFQTNIWLQ